MVSSMTAWIEKRNLIGPHVKVPSVCSSQFPVREVLTIRNDDSSPSWLVGHDAKGTF